MKRILLFLSIIILVSCVKDEVTVKDLNYSISPTFGVPIAKARIMAEKVIERYDEDGLVTTDDQGVLTLVYRDTLESLTADDFLFISDQAFSNSIALNASDLSELATFGTVTIESDEIYSIDAGDDRLDSIRFASGDFNLSLSTDGTIPASGTIAILDPFSGEEFISINFSDTDPPIALSANQDFSDLLLRLRNDSEYENGIRVALTVTFTDNGGTYPDDVNFDFSLTDFSIAAAGGYIAPRTIEVGNQQANISLFDSEFNGVLRLEDPTLNLFFFNGYGLGVRPVLTEIVGVNRLGDELVITSENISTLPVVEPAVAPGQPTLSEIVVDNQTITPSVTDFMAFQPNFVRGNLQLEVNPNNNPSNFINAGTELGINFEVELPIYGSLADFSLIDTTEVNFGDIVETTNDVEEIEQLDIRLFVRNALPLDAGVQIVFLDSVFNPIDSLFSEPAFLFDSAPVNLSAPVGTPDYGRVIGITENMVEVSIPRERIEALENASQMEIFVYGNTTSNGDHPIRLYPENFIEVNLAAKAKFNIDNE